MGTSFTWKDCLRIWFKFILWNLLGFPIGATIGMTLGLLWTNFCWDPDILTILCVIAGLLVNLSVTLLAFSKIVNKNYANKRLQLVSGNKEINPTLWTTIKIAWSYGWRLFAILFVYILISILIPVLEKNVIIFPATLLISYFSLALIVNTQYKNFSLILTKTLL